MQVAIFDVDGTLVSGKSTEKRFIAWLFRRGYLGPRQIASSAWFVISRFVVYGRHVFRKNKAYLSGLSEADVCREAAEFVAALPDDAWIGDVLAEMRGHADRGDMVVLLSGTLQPIIDALRARMGADDAIGTNCRVERDRYAAAAPLRHPFYDEKATLLDEIRDSYGIGMEDIHAYADSRFDIPLLAQVGVPVAVAPDRGLSAFARRKGWRIIGSA